MRILLTVILLALATTALADTVVIQKDDNAAIWSRATVKALGLNDDPYVQRYNKNYNYNGYRNPVDAQVQSVCGGLQDSSNKYRRCRNDVLKEQEKLQKKYRN